MKNTINPNEILEMVKAAGADSWHGLSRCDYEEFKSLLDTVHQNDTEHKTVFPDFVSKNGFIEHFHVTSGPISNKGYKNTEKQAKIQRNHEKFIRNTENNLSSQEDVAVNHHSENFLRDEESLENFNNSVKDEWIKHIKSLEKYNGEQHTSCFLISSDDILAVHENIGDSNSIYYGNLAKRGDVGFCLSYDEELLNFMYDYKDKIDYVVYVNIMRCFVEIIKVSNILPLKKFLEHRTYKINARIAIQASDLFGINVKNTDLNLPFSNCRFLQCINNTAYFTNEEHLLGPIPLYVQDVAIKMLKAMILYFSSEDILQFEITYISEHGFCGMVIIHNNLYFWKHTHKSLPPTLERCGQSTAHYTLAEMAAHLCDDITTDIDIWEKTEVVSRIREDEIFTGSKQINDAMYEHDYKQMKEFLLSKVETLRRLIKDVLEDLERQKCGSSE